MECGGEDDDAGLRFWPFREGLRGKRVSAVQMGHGGRGLGARFAMSDILLLLLLLLLMVMC